MKGALIEKGHECPFIFAGNAKFTALRTDTGNRITFQLKRIKPSKRWPVLPMGWEDSYRVLYKYNEDRTDGKGYVPIGVVFDKTRFWVSQRALMKRSNRAIREKLFHGAKVFKWLLDKLLSESLPETVQVWHQGSSGRCGKTLTVPLSINRGIGPECLEHQNELEQSLAGLALEYLEKRKKGVN